MRFLAYSRLTRRRLIAGGVAAGAMATVKGRPGRAASVTAFPDLDPVKTYVRLRGSTEPDLCFGWLSARRAAMIEGEVFPMMGVEAATVSRYTPRGDGTWDLVVREITVYTEVETGELMEELVMPVSGARVRPPALFLSPEDYIAQPYYEESGRLTLRAESDEELMEQMAPQGTYKFDQTIHAPTSDGESIWARSDYHYRLKPDDPGTRRMFYKEALTYRADLNEAMNTSKPSLDSTLSYSSSSGFRPWMQMGDIPGHDLTDGMGKKVYRVEDLPERYLAQVEQVYPGAYDNPEKLLERVE
jgi:hypothetical protein